VRKKKSGATGEQVPPKARRTGQREVIGWRELVSFSEWGIRNVLAKVDTGAKTSAIHAEDITELPDGTLQFRVILDRKSGHSVKVQAPRVRTSNVKPSNGVKQERHVVEAAIRLGKHRYKIDISLVARKDMMCRMLLGRAALSRRFVVDSAKVFMQSGKPGLKHKKKMLAVRRTSARTRRRKRESA
jgi:hypothetical protein